MPASRKHKLSVLEGEVSTASEEIFGERETAASGAPITGWTGEQLLAYQAMCLLMRLDSELLEARAQWNQDWFRRIMRIRPKAVSRLRRRWARLIPMPAIPLGRLRRRYHANLAGYLYERK